MYNYIEIKMGLGCLPVGKRPPEKGGFLFLGK